MKRFHFLAAVLITILAGCIANRTENQVVPEPLTVHQTSFRKTLRVCDDPNADSLQVEIASLAIDSVPEGLLTDSLRQFIREHSLADVSSTALAADVDDLFNRFAREYEQVAGHYGQPCHGWTLNRKLECLLNAGGLFSVSALDFSYTGGAHPNTNITLQTFDLTTGQLVDFSQIIDTAMLATFVITVEKTFRRVHDITDTTSWTSAGFWFEKGFTLPKNMALTPEGFYLVYNAYEVAPYSTGATELMIPATELEPLLNQEWKSRFLNIRHRE